MWCQMSYFKLKVKDMMEAESYGLALTGPVLVPHWKDVNINEVDGVDRMSLGGGTNREFEEGNEGREISPNFPSILFYALLIHEKKSSPDDSFHWLQTLKVILRTTRWLFIHSHTIFFYWVPMCNNLMP